MTKPTISQSQKRFNESVGALFVQSESKNEPDCLFLKSSSDIGVIRNGGRNGARFAPQSLLASFKKFSLNNTLKEMSFVELEVSDSENEEKNFHEAQLLEANKISKALENHKSRVCHIGGGHDHVYPLLKAFSEKYSQIIVINIDAHADTRTDEEFHSGTPFRQFSNEFSGQFHIFQIGLQPFANSFSTLSPLKNGTSSEVWNRNFTSAALDELFQKIESLIEEKTLVLFSLDADALNGFEVPGVSAVNPEGLSKKDLLNLWSRYQKLSLTHSPVMGIYELNPIYDSLASISMRTIGSFIFESFETR